MYSCTQFPLYPYPVLLLLVCVGPEVRTQVYIGGGASNAVPGVVCGRTNQRRAWRVRTGAMYTSSHMLMLMRVYPDGI